MHFTFLEIKLSDIENALVLTLFQMLKQHIYRDANVILKLVVSIFKNSYSKIYIKVLIIGLPFVYVQNQ